MPDIWHTAVELETFPLFRNLGKGGFTDITIRSRLARQTMQISGWSNGVADFDNDGWKDLFVARSNVLDSIADFSTRKYAEPNAVFRNDGKGSFEDVSTGAGPAFQLPGVHRGAAVGDLDNDGRIDVVVSALNGKAKIFRNISAESNSWVAFRLVAKSNRMAIGAQLKLTSGDGAIQYEMVTTNKAPPQTDEMYSSACVTSPII